MEGRKKPTVGCIGTELNQDNFAAAVAAIENIEDFIRNWKRPDNEVRQIQDVDILSTSKMKRDVTPKAILPSAGTSDARETKAVSPSAGMSDAGETKAVARDTGTPVAGERPVLICSIPLDFKRSESEPAAPKRPDAGKPVLFRKTKALPSSHWMLTGGGTPKGAVVVVKPVKLPHGWSKKCACRTCGKWNFVLYPPIGNQLRGPKELQEFQVANPDVSIETSVTHHRIPWTSGGASAASATPNLVSGGASKSPSSSPQPPSGEIQQRSLCRAFGEGGDKFDNLNFVESTHTD
jgi:hypothetical protein